MSVRRVIRRSIEGPWLVAIVLRLSMATIAAGAPTDRDVIPFDEGMEGETIRGAGGCAGVGCQLWQRVATQAHGGSFAIFGADVATAGDSYWTPARALAIPADATAATLTFWHRFAFERNGDFAYDGGVLEVSTSGGSNWTDAGAHILSGGYVGTILDNPERGNPLIGRPGWIGTLEEWQPVVVDLMPYRGQAFTFRFRLGTDNSNGGGVAEGWWVDDIRVSYRAPLTSCARGWSTAAPYPIAAQSPALAAIGDTLYSFGGRVGEDATALAFKYAVERDSWTPIAALPAPRSGASAVTDGTSIFILGGSNARAGSTTLWRYDPASNSYSTRSPASLGTAEQAAAYFDGQIYRIGGQTDLSDIRTATSTVEIYDVSGNSWTMGASYPSSRSGLAAIAADGYVYVAGGGGYFASTSKTYRYDPIAASWDDAPIAELPQAGAASGALYGDDWILLSAGAPYAWHRPTNDWRSLDQIPAPVAEPQVAAAGGFVHVLGTVNGQPGVLQSYMEIPCASECLGDCGSDGSVSVADLVRGVTIALSQQPLSACPSFDEDDDGRVAVNELVAAVNNALSGCPAR